MPEIWTQNTAQVRPPGPFEKTPEIRDGAWIVSERRPPPAAPAVEAGGGPGRRLDPRQRIIVVDDEPMVADTVAEILNRSGFEAIAVHSGEDAILRAREFRPGILLADVIMPDRDGVDTALELQQMLPHLRVILFSGQAQTADLLRRAREHGVTFELLPKPIHPRELLKKLRS